MTSASNIQVATEDDRYSAEGIEGMDDPSGSMSEYPIDDVLIRKDARTVYEINRRIKQGRYVMNPDFQRDVVWDDSQQSKLIESVIMRIPLPVLYLAEDRKGRMVVVDGLQRLTTFVRFLNDDLKLKLPEREDLNNKRFSELSPKVQNRIEDCNLILYVIDFKVPDRVRLDIFDRVNSGVPLTRQQMRNSLYSGPGTSFLKHAAVSDLFVQATGKSLKPKPMRDREFVNRFCAFQLLPLQAYNGDMDKWLADCLKKMNKMSSGDLNELSRDFRHALKNSYELFDQHAFRKSMNGERKGRRAPINASLWDVLTTGLSRYNLAKVKANADELRQGIATLLNDAQFDNAISIGTNHKKKVNLRFEMAHDMIQGVMDD